MANEEALTLDSLALHSGGLCLEELDLTPPKKIWEWAKSVDRDGALLVRPPKHELWEITAKVRIVPQTTMNLALDLLGTLTDRLQKAELRAQQGGTPISAVYVPAGSTYSYEIFVLGGEVEGIPRTMSDGWLVRTPVVTLKLFCLPFGYGAEVVTSTANSSTPILTFEVPSVGGDVPAEARLILSDGASQNRSHMEWGVEHRAYGSATSLICTADQFTTSGFAGTATTRTGAYS